MSYSPHKDSNVQRCCYASPRLDLRDIKVVAKVGGTIDDSEMVDGMVFDQKVCIRVVCISGVCIEAWDTRWCKAWCSTRRCGVGLCISGVCSKACALGAVQRVHVGLCIQAWGTKLQTAWNSTEGVCIRGCGLRHG